MAYGRARDRKLKRQQEAMVRAETYSKLTLFEKIKEQIQYRGKQYRKLVAKIKEVDENGCYTMPDGECIAPGKCIHSPKEV